MSRPTLFLLHALGSSAHAWHAVETALGDAFDCVAIDLPGFGAAAAETDIGVAAMADRLAATIAAHAPAAYLLVGHSMGGKLATILAARAEAGAPGLSALAGVVLLAGSPPSPEPIDPARRAEMIDWFRDGTASEEAARTFVAANVAAPLPPDVMAAAVADVRRASRLAWLGWLEQGSREDWGAAVGRLATPALIVAGGEDGDLGEAAQRRLNVPHYAEVDVAVIAGAAHLLPLEAAEDVAALIERHWRRVAHRALPPAQARLLASGRVAARTRAALVARLSDPADDAPRCLDPGRRAVLAALVERVLPGRGGTADLARRIEVELAAGPGDGWRFAALPPDREAWEQGLDTLDHAAGGFAGLEPAAQEAWLDRMAAGTCGDAAGGRLSPDQMRLWFEDVRAAAVRQWLSHPATMARIGYDGFATGGDGPRPQGYRRLAADDVEAWQLAPAGRGA